MRVTEAPVRTVEALTGDYFLLSLEAPEQAAYTKPGQFYMLGLPAAGLSHDPLLNRPISALDVVPGPSGGPAELRFLIKQVGRGTRLMSRLSPGDRLLCHGPLGRSFPAPPAAARLVLVGGGVGIAPLSFCARVWAGSGPCFVFYGGRNSAELPLAEPFREMGLAGLRLATEDGSQGERGLVTAPMEDFLNQGPCDLIYTCGPNAMMEAVCRLAADRGVAAWASLENRMGCGMGVCLGCALPIRTSDGLSMQRVCREGPVFEGGCIEWAALR